MLLSGISTRFYLCDFFFKSCFYWAFLNSIQFLLNLSELCTSSSKKRPASRLTLHSLFAPLSWGQLADLLSKVVDSRIKAKRSGAALSTIWLQSPPALTHSYKVKLLIDIYQHDLFDLFSITLCYILRRSCELTFTVFQIFFVPGRKASFLSILQW